MEDLHADFAAFLKSARAVTVMPPEDLGDWSARIASNAQRNGDSRADANPDTSVSGYYDSTADDGDGEPVERV
ncbi:MAG: hypothetical protein LBE44_05810 [Microbacterium hominis]|uniref:hypothetical protein n=1 Tax=Microbacterium aurum TaxID=36805 RepID=UPI00248E01B0|nr:hypothetical protein [Microbacterium aurum]MBZ6371408.1 hypothetical protein [Microbacterium hominis]